MAVNNKHSRIKLILYKDKFFDPAKYKIILSYPKIAGCEEQFII